MRAGGAGGGGAVETGCAGWLRGGGRGRREGLNLERQKRKRGAGARTSAQVLDGVGRRCPESGR